MTAFLDDRVPVRPRLKLPPDLVVKGLYLGNGNLALEVLVVEAQAVPTDQRIRQIWKDRLQQRAAPLLVVALSDDKAALCGPAGEHPPVRRIEINRAERLCNRALDEPDCNAAIRFLQDALPSLESDLPGIRNEGLLSNHELIKGVQGRADWASAQARTVPLLGAEDHDLLRRLGFAIEILDDVTCLIRRGERHRAIAVLLQAGQTPEGAEARFQNFSPVSWALAKAQQRDLPWVVVSQADRLRLYPAEAGAGVGRRGRTDTWIELRTGLMSESHAGLLWLIFSADALEPGGTLTELLENSKRFAADLAVRLRERIYDHVVPKLAKGIADARGLQQHTAEQLRLTYAMAITVLFRLLFIAYAEDRDFLPYNCNDTYRRRALKSKAQELDRQDAPPGAGAHLWQEIKRLFEAVRIGDAALGVPAYGGGLFETDPAISQAGAELATIDLPDAVFKPVLRGLLLDLPGDLASPGAGPVDFRSLRVREFGTIYEGLLDSELAVATTDLVGRKEGKDLVYVPAKAGEHPHRKRGETYLHNRSGARKSSGSYFTPSFAVDHLLTAALVPALKAHVERLKTLEPAAAADAFFDIRIADIAMGSGHFLVAAVDVVEQALSGALNDRSLPGVTAELGMLRVAAETELKNLGLDGTQHIEDSQLLRRLIARRCIYGVDLNPLAVDLARLSVWIHTFVPGLPLSLLDHRLVEGNALVGIATLAEARSRLQALAGVGLPVEPADMIAAAVPHLTRLARISDATPQDLQEARRAYLAARNAVAAAQSLFDAAIAVAAGHVEFRIPVNQLIDRLTKKGLPLDLRETPLYRQIVAAVAPTKALHMPTAFPEVFHRSREGFDVIVGNPPWEKLRVEAHEFWARHFPGLRGLKSGEKRDAEIRKQQKARPDLVALEREERAASEALRDAMRTLPGMNTGHPDLFRAFMARFPQLLVADGHYGAVLPGDAFKIKGNAAVRKDLDERAKCVDVQMLTNRSEWIFKDVDGRKLIALVAVELDAQNSEDCAYVLRPEYHRADRFHGRSLTDCVERKSEWLRQYSTGLVLPTLPTAGAAASIDVLDTLMRSPRISDHPSLSVRRVYADVETSRSYKAYYQVKGTESGLWPVYGGDSFDIWEPDTKQYFAEADGTAILGLVQTKRENAHRGSPYFDTPEKWRKDPKTHPCRHPRIAYRDVTNRTNTRTLITALIPPDRVVVQSAPWVLWTDPRHPAAHEAYLLGIMSSLPADWWMRRFVEGHVDEEAFQSLRVPVFDPSKGGGARVVALAGRLACPDDRFADWAKSVGVAHGPLGPEDKQAMIEELDAIVARLYGLSPDQLTHIFDTFHEWPEAAQTRAWAARRDRTVAILQGLS